MSGVLVVLERRNAAITRTSFEALAAGQSLAKQLSLECSAAILGESIAALAGELSGKQLASIHAVEHPLLQQYTADGTTTALQQLIAKLAPACGRDPDHESIAWAYATRISRFAANGNPCGENSRVRGITASQRVHPVRPLNIYT